MTDDKQHYDLIGDIHGCSESLATLLGKLGYQKRNGVYRHPSRRVIFLGDFIDREPQQRAVIDIVRPMIEEGHALAVMGNHEFNAIAWFTEKPAGGYLREHSHKNLRQHLAFLCEYSANEECYAEIINWFKSLPLWLDLPGLRVIHACWDRELIQRLVDEESLNPHHPLLTNELLARASDKSQWQYVAIETLLKGKEAPLPEGRIFNDKDGNPRHNIRIRWWDNDAITYQDAYIGPNNAISHIPDEPIDLDHLIEYGHDEPPVFLGHYWMEGEPVLLAPNIACLDYSVANKQGGSLVAYRWDGETRLAADKFVHVARIEQA